MLSKILLNGRSIPVFSRLYERFFQLFFVFLLFNPLLYSQELQEERVHAEDTVFVIRSWSYFITGKTKESAIEREGEFKTGGRFTGNAELDAYVKEKKQDLYNIRSLISDDNSITYTLGETEEDGAVPVHLAISVTDSTNWIILPEPNYDSNFGFSLSIKIRDYNFLGTLSPQKLDFIWGSDDRHRNYIGYRLELNIPFAAFGFNWEFTSYNELRYYLSGEPSYNINTLGLAMELPASFTTFTFGLEQGVVIHEENTRKIRDFESTLEEYHDWYLFSKAFVDWKIPTPLRVGKFGAVVYTPGVYGIIKYQPNGDVGKYRHGPSTGIKQKLGFEKINWLGNFRQGLKVSVFNDNEYNYFRKEWLHSAGFLSEGHIKISKLFGISGRILYTKWINDFYEYAGDVIRGYKDSELSSKERLSVNLEFPFRLIRFVPSEWTGNRKYRYFDFEQHWSLFVDLVMLDCPYNTRSFKPQDIISSAGLELITFPLNWRSFYLRISAGWNIREWVRIGRPPSGIYREFYIGLGHFF